MPSNSKNQTTSTSVNNQTVLNCLLNADLIQTTEFLKKGLLNFKLPFSWNLDSKQSIWHVLIVRKKPENIQFIREMFSLYKSKYGHEVMSDELNAINENGLTPLLLAAFLGNMEALPIYITAGADPTLCTKKDKADLKRMLLKNYFQHLSELNIILDNYHAGKYRLPPSVQVPPPTAKPSNTKLSNKENLLTTTFWHSISKVGTLFTTCSTAVDKDESHQKLLADPQTITTAKKVQ